jgi:DMSO/TMAO reductase YedYZ molybdopterin-dependent catalytic subunit
MSIFDSLFGRKESKEPSSGEVPAEDAIVSPDVRREHRIPPGQVETKKWPVLDASGTPHIDMATWKLEVVGLVEEPWEADWAAFRALPAARVYSDFHCVTRWSKLDNLWEGVLTQTLAERVKIDPNAKFVLVHGYDNAWTTNVPIEDFLAEDAILAWSHDGKPLEPDHGGPLRLVIPRLYAWKSAKWVRAIEFLAKDEPGFWEHGGYHMRGDPWQEQRYRWS